MNDNPFPKMGGAPEAQGYVAHYVNGPAQGDTTETSVGIPPPYRYYCRLKEDAKPDQFVRGWWRWDNDGAGPIPFDDPQIEVAVYGLQSVARGGEEVKAKYGISERPSVAEKQEAPE